MAKARLNPAQILALGFLAAITIGTILLSLPISTANGQRLPFVDALFTATSATCVTGLKVVDTGSYFSLFGQLVILVLIQLGGLGIMTMATLFGLMIGRRLGLRERLVVQEALKHSTLGGIRVLLRYVIILTLSIEGLGAIFLYLRWKGMGISYPGYCAVFHAVSGFCNAGFSLFKDSLVGYQADPVINVTMLLLIILGGLGFTVLTNLRRYRPGKKETLSLHTKVVLSMTFFLIVLSVPLIFLLERNNTLSTLPVGGKILGAVFQAITPRTAGFNTLEIGQMRGASLFLLMILMFIGASPGSTGGGVKTSTFGVFLVTIWTFFRGKKEITIFKRTISHKVTREILTVVAFAFGLVVLATFLLLLTEGKEFIKVLFEVFSAFGTVGLSTGITDTLSNLGRIIITITMFMGRIGPLTIAVAMGQREYAPLYKYPEERVMIG
ncbi:TrkH family potassium uptake protein [bacterium]|nr:TrkH family potassium uptake protein [bacterium]MBU4310970.1 TrkH family potassium uptake protein [bacterium]MBU4561427.1 TrkH family potassium uptake protein [bacterium]MCG2676499.1 TrkH family potassium uptake protein [bacterium]MCG2677511.1 TrkH family potassium uptake protein [bacterium]